MQVSVIGINHASAHLNMREILARFCQERFSCKEPIIRLLTCNRVELYSQFSEGYFKELFSLYLPQIPETAYYYRRGENCFKHLVRVLLGLDSVLIGETEIIQQVKSAYYETVQRTFLPKEMHYLFQKSLKLAKEVRTQQKFMPLSPSLPKILWKMLQSEGFDPLTQRTLLVGRSEINQKIAAYWRLCGAENIVFSNRTPLISNEYPSIPWSELHRWNDFDTVIVGTSAQYYILPRPSGAITTRVIVDLAVPRNVDPLYCQMTALYDLERLQPYIEESIHQKRANLHQLEESLTEKVQRQTCLYREWAARRHSRHGHPKSRRCPDSVERR